MEIDTIKATIEERHKEAAEAGLAFSKALNNLRNIEFRVEEDNEEEIKQAMELGRDIDRRTSFLLRALLVQYGNVLFL